MSVKARYAPPPFDMVLCGVAHCRGQLPAPAAKEIRWAPDDQVIFELNGWQVDEDGVERRVGRNRGNRSVKRARANTDAMHAGKKMRAQEVATTDGRRAKTLPFEAACPLPECGAINIIDDSLVESG